MAPTEDPECTRIIVSDWRRLKCWETTATVGRYARPLPRPYPTPWERKTWYHLVRERDTWKVIVNVTWYSWFGFAREAMKSENAIRK